MIDLGLQENIALQSIFIDGITRCGKSSMSGLIPSLSRMEHIQFCNELELTLPALALGHISLDYARAFLRIYFNEKSYNLHISRNVNFRPGDQTGIDNFRNPNRYYERLNIVEGDSVIEACRASKRYLPFQTHDLLINIGLLNQLQLDYKMISLWRHPVDNIYSWWTRGWGDRFRDDPRGFTLLTQRGGVNYPWYVAGRELDIDGLNAMEICVEIATDLLQRAVAAYNAAGPKEKILLMTFEEFCKNPEPELRRLCQFLEVEPTPHTPDALMKARFPRALDPAQLDLKISAFRAGVSRRLFEKLIHYAEQYEGHLYGLHDG